MDLNTIMQLYSLKQQVSDLKEDIEQLKKLIRVTEVKSVAPVHYPTLSQLHLEQEAEKIINNFQVNDAQIVK